MQIKGIWFLIMTAFISGCASSRQEIREQTVRIYLVNTSLEAMDMKTQKGTPPPFVLYAVERTIRSASPERAALEELLKGPNEGEIPSGYSSMLEGLELLELTVQDGAAVAEFNGEVRLSGLLAGPRLRRQVEQTLLQFETIETVSVRINGREDFDSLK